MLAKCKYPVSKAAVHSEVADFESIVGLLLFFSFPDVTGKAFIVVAPRNTARIRCILSCIGPFASLVIYRQIECTSTKHHRPVYFHNATPGLASST